MSKIIPFDFEGQEVRVVWVGDEPWFVAVDVCRVLDHTNSRVALERLDEDEKGVSTVYTPGGPQQMAIINESGVYSLILTSRKPAAKRFKKWITSEVLPSIRRSGTYAMPHLEATQPIDFEEGAKGDVDDPSNERLWLNKIGLASKLYGRQAARWMWQQSPFPVPPGKEVAGGQSADGALAECLDILRAWEPPGQDEALSVLAELPVETNGVNDVLARVGIKIDPAGWNGFIALAIGSPAVAQLFRSTPWAHNTWCRALAAIPGVRKSPNVLRFGGAFRARALLLPRHLMESGLSK